MSDFENGMHSELSEGTISSSDVSKEYFDHIKRINDIFYDQIKI